MSNEELSCVYGFDYPSRALCSLSYESDEIIFFVGTQSVKQSNKIFKINYDEENNTILSTFFDHAIGEIWSISSSPFAKNIISTCYNQIDNGEIMYKRASVWSVEENEDMAPQINLLLSLNSHKDDCQIYDILWHPSGSKNQLISISPNKFTLLDLSQPNIKVDSSAIVSEAEIKTGRWNSNIDFNQVFTINGVFIKGWDLRTMKRTFNLCNGPYNTLRNIDVNPNRSHMIVTCDDDAKLKFWDLRMLNHPDSEINLANKPSLVMSGHTHWIWTARFNPFHDQLVLSGGSDSRVLLSRAYSVSSEALLLNQSQQPNHHNDINPDIDSEQSIKDDHINGKPEEIFKKRQNTTVPNCIIKKFDDDHEDSVYAAEWSNSDPWHFASLSYDGRFCINKVPKTEKYRIIL